ncbi:glycosyltransferase [Halocynthiibacter sp. C4]|uniref:glycosyltransferase n=1 Tax=Halocynthiibacter sp. C4 TaxID=2992758 RepID=UPI00237BE82F|nr:glycosyltransferase [Halocynthiibacter sp. C4]MDE0590101.1 glycosyltransferase [Halocynthiibacter sp. C4]
MLSSALKTVPVQRLNHPKLPRPVAGRRPLGEILVAQGALAPGDLVKSLALQNREDVPLGDILLSHGLVSEDALFSGLSEQWGTETIDLSEEAPDPRLIDDIGVRTCLMGRFVPWKRIGAVTVICTSRPAEFEDLLAKLPEGFGPVQMAISSEKQVLSALQQVRKDQLIENAETCVSEEESCRNWQSKRHMRIATCALLGFAAALIAVPKLVFTALFFWAIATLILSTGLKLAAALTQAPRFLPRKKPAFVHADNVAVARLPVVSVMVPLFKERKIASHLIRRLARISYPRELLDICLVVEADDLTTQHTIAQCELPTWARVITVPAGSVRTKPRALNYALDFCRGTIIGVYDAEDAPDPGQIHAVVRNFHQRGPEVACLQGILDFYNPRTNWLSRCFTIEYATWFRLVLPGLQKLGFAIPLGGTTLFFRREALERLGGWDAHNVTEDADLGIRLARHGYKTEMIHTVTQEEANCRLWPWVKQRSRWLKGYAITWAVHMRHPRVLLRELGAWRFFGVQLLFLGSLSQYILAPLLWSMWFVLLPIQHPLEQIFAHSTLLALGGLFLFCEAVSIGVSAVVLSKTQHKRLRWWLPSLHLYFPLGTIAAFKGMFELLTKPFYWDKTEHGIEFKTKNSEPAKQA